MYFRSHKFALISPVHPTKLFLALPHSIFVYPLLFSETNVQCICSFVQSSNTSKFVSEFQCPYPTVKTILQKKKKICLQFVPTIPPIQEWSNSVFRVTQISSFFPVQCGYGFHLPLVGKALHCSPVFSSLYTNGYVCEYIYRLLITALTIKIFCTYCFSKQYLLDITPYQFIQIFLTQQLDYT